jgi:hypothetical protein
MGKSPGDAMTARLTLALCAVLALTACNTRLNPFNWFGRSEPAAPATLVTEAPADPRDLVADVLTMTVEPLPGGAILRATGRTPTQGYWDAELVLREGPDEDPAVQVYDFRIFPPVVQMDVNTPQSREVTVALYLSDIDLDGVRSISVQGAANARAVRR